MQFIRKLNWQILLLLSLIVLKNHSFANPIYKPQFKRTFKNFDACFLLYDLNNKQFLAFFNPKNRCNTRIAADSTFKIPLSLMAFNDNIITPHTVFKWNKNKNAIPAHNQDQTPATWIKYSVVWVSQSITPKLGIKRIQSYLKKFKYGNQDFSGDPGANNGLRYAWLSSSLRISAFEQLQFLKNMLSNHFLIHPEAITNTQNIMYLGHLSDGSNLYGKTGAGRHGNNERLTNPGKFRDGWFIGFIVKDRKKYIFVTNLTDKKIDTSPSSKLYGSEILKPITIKILNQYFTN